MSVISSEVIITGKDAGAGAMFDSIAAKIDRMAKGAKVSEPFSNLSNALTKAQTQLKAFEKFEASQKKFAESRTSLNVKKKELEEFARVMRSTEAPTKQMQAEYKHLQAEVTRLAAAYDKQKTSMLESKHAAESFGSPLTNLGKQQRDLKKDIDATSRSLTEQVVLDRKAATQAEALHKAAEKQAERRGHFMAHHGLAGTLLGAAAGAATVHSVLGVGERAWEAGVERQHTIIGMETAGMKPEEIGRAQTQAEQVSHNAPNLSVSQIMELHKEARSAVQHPEEVYELMPDLAKAASALKGMGNEGNIADLVKAGESLGLMSHPERFHRFLEGQVKAMQVFGRTISTDQIYEAAKYSKATGSTLSDDFLNGTMPTLIQEMHGSSAGDALSAMGKRFDGGLAHQHLAVQRLLQMGLLDDPSKIVKSKTGEIIGYTGKLKGDELRHSDPGKWFQTFYKDGAAKAGAKSLEDINKLLAETLPSTAANLGRILIQQEDSIRQHQENLHNATGLDETVEKQRQDWAAATGAFKASLEDLGAAVTGVNMGRAAKGLSWLSDEIKSFAKLAADHPYIAVPSAAVAGGAALGGAGYLGWQFATAGVALQTSATMLDEAAVRLGANPLNKLPGAVTAGEVVAGGGAVAEGGAVVGGAAGLAAGLGLAGGIAGLAWLIQQSHEAQKAGHGGAWAPATFATRDEDEDALSEQKGRLYDLQARADRARTASKFPDMPNPVVQQLEDEIADLKNQIAAREASLARVPKFPIGPMSDGEAPTMLGFDVHPGRRGGVSLGNVPMVPSVGGNAFLTGASPYAVAPIPPPVVAPLDIRPQAQQVEVGVTVGDPKFDGQLRVVAEPSQWLIAKIDNLAQTFSMGPTAAVAKPSTGPSMAAAGLPAHPGRMGPN